MGEPTRMAEIWGGGTLMMPLIPMIGFFRLLVTLKCTKCFEMIPTKNLIQSSLKNTILISFKSFILGYTSFLNHLEIFLQILLPETKWFLKKNLMHVVGWPLIDPFPTPYTVGLSKY